MKKIVVSMYRMLSMPSGLLAVFLWIVSGSAVGQQAKDQRSVRHLMAQVQSMDAAWDVSTIEERALVRDGYTIRIRGMRLNDNSARIEVVYDDHTFLNNRTFYTVGDSLICLKEYRIEGDNISRFEEAKAMDLGMEEMRRSQRTLKKPIAYYFVKNSDWPESLKPGKAEIMAELKFYRDQLGY